MQQLLLVSVIFMQSLHQVRASQLAQSSERVGSLIPASQQGFQPCCEAGIREPTLSNLYILIIFAEIFIIASHL